MLTVELYDTPPPPLIIPVFIPHLGCPRRCVFCDQRTISGSSAPAPRDIFRIVARYRSMTRSSRSHTELSFYGGSFTALPADMFKRYVEAGAAEVAAGTVDMLRCSTRPDAIDNATTGYLQAHGFGTVELGVQSFSDRVLEKMERGHDAACVLNAAEILRGNNLKVIYQLMPGFPGEDEIDRRRTIDLLSKSPPDGIRIYPFAPLPGTPVERMIRDGCLPTPDFDAVIDHAAALYSAAVEAAIPVIRIGLPLTGTANPWYPDNLSQVVVARMLVFAARDGRTHIRIPRRFETSAYTAAANGCDITIVP